MTLPDKALMTLADAKGRLGITDNSKDALLEGLIKAATSLIEGYCNRVFVASAAVVDKVRGYGSTEIMLTRPPIVSITSVTDRFAQTVDPTSYELDGDDAKQGGYLICENGWLSTDLMLQPNTAQDQLPGHERADWTVTYKGGFNTPQQYAASSTVAGCEDLPADVTEACWQTVLYLYSKQTTPADVRGEGLMSYNVQYGAVESTMDMSSGLPKIVCAMINSYVILGQAG